MNSNDIFTAINIKDRSTREEYYVWINRNADCCNRCKDLHNKFFRKSNHDIPERPHPNCKCELRKQTNEMQIKAQEHLFAQWDRKLIENKPPTFKGWEAPRHSMHDELIAYLVTDFNANKMEYAGCTREQAAGIPDLTAALVKAWLIQESGGSDKDSLAAWPIDPGQVNNPGTDWDAKAKGENLGLKDPGDKRNTGNVRDNLKAAIKFLVRKGFNIGASAQRERPGGFFDSWEDALERYNWNPKIERDGRPHYKHYAEKIMRRAAKPDANEPNEVR